ncbi:MAG TPA: glycosyltransferase family 4 protein [Chloroflexota bacterium]
MKILVISNLYPPEIVGGYEIQCSQAVAELRRRGHDVVVLTSIPRRPVGQSPSHVLRLLGTPDVYSRERADLKSPFWEFEANLLNVENVFLLLEVLRDWEPDVCYLWNLVALGGLGLIAALEYLGVPWVWHLGDAVPALLCNFDGQLPALGEVMGSRFSGRFIACSQTVLASVERLVHIEGRTRILPNWTMNTVPMVERDYFGGEHLKLAFAGRLAEEKGIFLVLETAAQLLASGYSNFSLDIIGAGLLDEVVARISELGIEKHVSLMGWHPPAEVKRHLQQCDVFVFPASAEDPMPLAALEAAAVGCVPLLPWLSGVSEWLVDGVHCLKAERSPEGFAEVIRAVMDGDIDLSQLSRHGAKAVHESFDIEAVMPDVERELVVASASTWQPNIGLSDDFYRIALIADALLRQHILEGQQP